MSATPRRVQLRRLKGWKMPANTLKVDRSTAWGNPFKVSATLDAAASVAAFRAYVLADNEAAAALRLAIRAHLAGKNLACWCKLDGPCHADVLLAVANRDDAI